MFKNYTKTFLLLAALTALMLLIGNLVAGRNGLYIAIALAITMNFLSYWFSDKIVLAMYRAKPAPKEKYASLHHDIEEIAKKAKMPKPRVYILPLQIMNAFATGRDTKHAAVAVTEGLLSKLSREELKGVLAHEMSHVRNRDTLIMTIAAMIAGIISYVAVFARMSLFYGDERERSPAALIGLLIAAIIAPISALLIQLAISRTREYIADESAARTLGSSNGLANALLKLEEGAKKMPLKGNEATSHLFIVNPFRGGFASLFSTHPQIEKRVQRLKELKF